MKVGDNAVVFARRLRNDWMMLLPGEDVSECIEIPATVVAVHDPSFTVSCRDEAGYALLKAFPFSAIPEQIRIIPVHLCGIERCTNQATISIALPGDRYARFCDHCAGQIAVMVHQRKIG